MTMATAGKIERDSVGWSIGISIFLLLAGIFAVLIPPVAGIAVALVVGWLLIFSGAMHVVFAWHTRTAGGFLWQLLIGVLYAGIGIYTLIHPVAGLASLTLVLAFYLLAESMLELVLWLRLRHMGGSPWLLVDGIVTLVLAVLIWRTWPSSTEWVIGTLVGFSMLFSGASRLMVSLAARRGHAALPIKQAA